jgi:membrane associated rhomboid family serine protease
MGLEPWRRRFTRELVLGTEEPVEIPERAYVLEAIIALNIIVYIITSAGHAFLQTSTEWTARLGYIPAMLLVNPASAYRIFTAMFTHANIFHIFFNMYFLYVFGRAVEKTLGHLRFLILYIVSGILAAVFHTVFIYLQNPADLAIPSVGASGAISGVLGAYMLLYPGTRLTACFFLLFLPVCFEMLAAYYILFWFAIQVFEGYFDYSSNVAFFAHAGGFLAGIALLPLVVDRARLRYLKMLSRAQRLFDIIVFLPYQLQRRGLSPGTKTAFILLAGLLLTGTAVAYVYASTQQSLISSYTINWRVGDISGSDIAFVGITGGHAFPIPTAIKTMPGQLVATALDSYGLFYRPDLSGRELTLQGPLLHPVETKAWLTLYVVRVYLMQPLLIEARYNQLGVLERAGIDAIIYRLEAGRVVKSSAAPLEATVALQALADPLPLMRLMSLISFLTTLAALYVVAYRDTEYVITPE